MRAIKKVCWENVGIAREEKLLAEAQAALVRIQRDLTTCGGEEPVRLLEAIEAENVCLSARTVVEAALLRTESRGAHFRLDHPKEDDARWRVNVFVKMGEDGALLAREREVGARVTWDA